MRIHTIAADLGSGVAINLAVLEVITIGYVIIIAQFQIALRGKAHRRGGRSTLVSVQRHAVGVQIAKHIYGLTISRHRQAGIDEADQYTSFAGVCVIIDEAKNRIALYQDV